MATDQSDQPVYADPGTAEPFPELFFTDPSGLLRFIQAGGDGQPSALVGSLAFAGIEFGASGDVTESVNPADLTRLGCAGPFPVFAGPEAGGEEATRYVEAGGRIYAYVGTIPATEAPTEEPTDEATEASIEEPTEAVSEEPTEAPTEEPVTETATEEVTGEPTEQVTDEPTDEATEAATEAESEGGPEDATPPGIDPADSGSLVLVPESGDGGQPGDLPREAVFAGERFLFDRWCRSTPARWRRSGSPGT